MSLNEYRGSVWAFRELMRQAERDIAAGDQKPVVQKWKKANPAKTEIGWFKRRLIRGEFRRRA